MTEQYLICHKVRGQSSFDVAERIEIAGEEAWITNTGHRAYPYWSIDLSSLDLSSLPAMPDSLPDFFTMNAAPKPKAASTILASLGLAPKRVEIKRRV